ncbi:MAG: hypothetical protein OSB12_10870 [Planctomycetota bacterium]|nr:hypothetical protein [Planctomycetota bacterium]
MGYFRLQIAAEQVDQFRQQFGVPQIKLHAELRYAERVLGRSLSQQELLNCPQLRRRCQDGILRNFEEATEVICSGTEEGVYHLFRRCRCLILKGHSVITLYDTPENQVGLALRKKRIQRPRLPGIETFEAIRARRSA